MNKLTILERHPELARKLNSVNAQMVDLTNVAEWYYASPGSYGLDSFAALVSPWTMAWYEFRHPKMAAVFGKYQEDVWSTQESIGVAMHSSVATEADRVEARVQFKAGKNTVVYRSYDDIDRLEWIQGFIFYVKTKSGDFIESFEGILCCDKEGIPIGDDMTIFPRETCMHNLREAWHGEIIFGIYAVFFGISLFHCKNVSLLSSMRTPRMRRMSEKGKGDIRYKTLDIEPFRAQVVSQSKSPGEEIKRALHICRGHFATYSESAPLFGKYTGTFWRPMHVRGNKQAGEVVKDYRVKLDRTGDN